MVFAVRGRVEAAHDEAIWSVSWHRDRIVTGSLDASIKLWSADPLAAGQQLSGHLLGVVQATLDASAQYVASSSLDSRVRLWAADSGQLLHELDPGTAGTDAWGVAFSPDSARLASAGQSGTVTVWDVASGAKLFAMPPAAAKFALSIAFSDDGRQVACGAQDGVVSVFDVEQQALVRSLEGHSMAVRSVAFLPSSSSSAAASSTSSSSSSSSSSSAQLFVTASDDRLLKLFDSRAAQPVAVLQGHVSWVLACAVAPGGALLASGSADRSVKVWDVGTRQALHTFAAHDDSVWAVAFSDSGAQLASAGDDRALFVYNLG